MNISSDKVKEFHTFLAQNILLIQKYREYPLRDEIL